MKVRTVTQVTTSKVSSAYGRTCDRATARSIWRPFAPGLGMCTGNHSCVWITAGQAAGAVLQHGQAECPVTTTDIENREAVQPAHHVEDEMVFQ